MGNRARNKAILTERIFAAANRSKLSYCLLRNLPGVREGSSKDVDILVSPRHRKRFDRAIVRTVARDRSWSVFQTIRGPAGTRVVLYHRDDYTLLFDLQSLVYIPSGWIPARVFLQQPGVGPGGIRILDSVAYLSCLKMHDEIKPKPEYRAEIRRAFANNPGLEN